METGFLEQPLQPASADSTHAQLTVLDLFDQQVQKTPHHIAVQYEESTLSYRELDEKSNQLANYLITNNISINQYVIVKVGSSIELSIIFWGIIKAGAIYVPIEQDITHAKMQQIQHERKTSLFLSKLPKLNAYSKKQIKNPIQIIHLAYVIFTSGSTGKPKGVMISHK